LEAATLTRNVVPNEEATKLEVLRAAAQLGVTALAAASGKANIFNLTLLGQYGANFNPGTDRHSGTLITDPPASSSVVQTPFGRPSSQVGAPAASAKRSKAIPLEVSPRPASPVLRECRSEPSLPHLWQMRAAWRKHLPIHGEDQPHEERGETDVNA
jgi:hypothetical protein